MSDKQDSKTDFPPCVSNSLSTMVQSMSFFCKTPTFLYKLRFFV